MRSGARGLYEAGKGKTEAADVPGMRQCRRQLARFIMGAVERLHFAGQPVCVNTVEICRTSVMEEMANATVAQFVYIVRGV